jgi:hypothetical protein
MISPESSVMYLNPDNKKLKISRKEPSDDNSTIGFGVQKILDKNSIFCGLPSLNTIASYVEVVIDHWHFIPSKNDSTIVARTKTLALLWRLVRNIDFHRSRVLERTDLYNIDFGISEEVIGDLIEQVVEPDEVFRPQDHTPFSPPYWMYRYPIGSGFLYWIQERDSELTKKVKVTKNITKDHILDMLWANLGRVIQLEADDGELKYVKTELTQKKIFGSSNKLIEKLKDDYKYFRENKLSRGYLLIGKPGTGKTGIVNSIVESVEGRVFIISGFDTVPIIEEMESLFVQMKPDFIIFDDCDRSNSGPTYIKAVLKMLESVKDKNPHTNFLFTANTFSGILYDEAVTRKGRIDQIYEVPEPSSEDRKEIFIKYAAQMGITFSVPDLDKCIEASDGMTGADIKELCIQLQRATIDEVFERAKEIDQLRDKYGDNDDDILAGGKNSIIKALGLTKSWQNHGWE